MIKISIIIVSYNVESYISQCVNSVLNQTLKGIEIICVDDCSSDNTYSILEDISKTDDRITLLQNYRNYGGASFGINRGIELSKGEYIYILDSDDYIDNDYLYNLYSTAKKYDTDIVSNLNIIRISENSSFIENYSLFKPDKWKKEDENTYLEGKSSINDIKDFYSLIEHKEFLDLYPWNKIFRREFLINNNLRFMPILDGIEGGSNDFHFVNKVMLHHPSTSYNHKSKYYHRIRENAVYRSVIKKPMLLTASMKRMIELVEYCKSMSSNELDYLSARCWFDTYYRYRMIEDKRSIYKYMHEYTKEMYFDKSIISEEVYYDYLLIKLNEDYDKYLTFSSVFNELLSKNSELNEKMDKNNNLIKLFGVYKTKKQIRIIIFGISIAIKRAEQSRAEQSRAEQSRAEQSRAEQSRAEQSRAYM